MNIKIIVLRVLLFIPSRLFNYFLFIYKVGYIPNFSKPKSLNEKIGFIKENPLCLKRRMVADRIKVRDYVVNKSPSCNLIKILWKGRELTKEVYDALPNKFVVKASHGAGMVNIFNKNKDNFNDLLSEIVEWMNYDYGKLTRQWVYEGLEKILIVEEFKGGNLPDYKFFCMNGKVEMIQLDLDRFENHTRNLYDRDFNLINVTSIYPKNNTDQPIPNNFLDAVKIAEQLAVDFDFIRVDLYILNDKIFFGEMTNTPENGMARFTPREFDFELGEKIYFSKEFNCE